MRSNETPVIASVYQSTVTVDRRVMVRKTYRVSDPLAAVMLLSGCDDYGDLWVY